MYINNDYFDNLEIPNYILCKANKERIGTLKCNTKTLDVNLNEPDTITFSTYMYIDNEKNPYYEAVDIMKYILLPNYGFFCISDCQIHSEGTEYEYKEVTATSYECLLGQKYLETFVINYGLTESLDSVRFYDIGDKEHSLLNLVLNEKCPEWKIGHVDTALYTMQRCFNIDKKDVYSFLMQDVAKAFECVFIFDTLLNTVHVYQEKNFGEDTGVHASYNNLIASTDMSCSLDNIKTCITVTGSDDLTLREINMGYESLYSFEPYHSLDFMSQGLYDSYDKWEKLRADNLDAYTALLSEYQKYIIQINDLTHNKMPDDPESTDWTLYGLVPLQERLAVYEQQQSVMMKSGWGNSEHQAYKSHYLPVYNTIKAIKTQIDAVNAELTRLKDKQNVYYYQMSEIITNLAMENNFTKEQLEELSPFIRETEISSDNFVVTDTMTDEEKFQMLNEMLEYANNELKKVSTPQLSFSVDMANIFTLPQFSRLYGKFNVGNYLWVTLRDDYNIKAILTNMHINFYDVDDFTVTFGNIFKKKKTRYNPLTDVLKEVKDVSTSVSFNASFWNQSAKETDSINKMLEAGLLAAGQYLKSGEDSELRIDSRGIFVNTTSGDYANKDSIFIGGGRILFTDDNWKTVAMAVGRADVNGESRFGVFADFVIAGYVAGSTVEGSKIVGGTLESTNYKSAKYGSFLDLEKGTFEFNAKGEQKLTLDENGNLMVKGTIEAYSGHIGGANISKNSIYADNNKWYINSDGSAGFSDIKVTGGSISGTTLSNGNGSFYVDANGNLTCNNISSIGLIRGAIPQFSSLVHDSEAHQLALQAIALAQSAANTAKQAADDAREVAEDVKVHVMNINDTIIPDILGEIRGLDGRVTALENNS